MYYKQNKTQAEIAKVLKCSRSLISMMLSEAAQKGIVKIDVQFPAKRVTSLEQRLRAEFDIQDAIIANRGSLDDTQMLRLIGRLAAMYLQNHLPEDGVLGLDWGAAVFEVVNAVRPMAVPGMKIVQLSGALSRHDQSRDGHEVTRALGQLFSAKFYALNAPAVVASVPLRQALMEENQIKEVMALASKVNLALIGIGATDPEGSILLRMGNLSEEEIQELSAHGAVGDVLGYHYDINGNVIDSDINRRVVGVELSAIRRKRCTVLAVAGGENKSKAILGALRGGLVDVLVSDNLAVEKALEIARVS
jgi:DNA-binding transcriptional regulator LsrR (DeoR family)